MVFGIHKQSNQSKQTLDTGVSPSTPEVGSASSSGEEKTLLHFLQASRVDPPTYDHDSTSPLPHFPDSPSSSRAVPERHSFPHAQRRPRSTSPAADIAAEDLPLESQYLQSQSRRNTGQQPVQKPEKKKGLFSNLRRTRATEEGAPISKLGKRQEQPVSVQAYRERASSEQQRRGQAGLFSNSRSTLSQEGAEEDCDFVKQSQSNNTLPLHARQQTTSTFQGGVSPYFVDSPSRSQHSQEQIHSHRPSGSADQIYYQGFNRSQQAQDFMLGTSDGQTANKLYRTAQDIQPEYRDESRTGSAHSNGPSPTGTYSSQRSDYLARTTSAGPPPTAPPKSLPQLPVMAPAVSSQNRKSADAKLLLQAQAASDSRDGPPPYRPPTAPSAASNPPVSAPQGSNYRGGPPQREQSGAINAGELGRSTPPPTPAERDVNEAYKELLQKYKKVKGLYFEKTAHVEQLQNTIANQRLSQSRTSLDDNEYMTRFQRLDGAITNLAFNIRKDWKAVPPWLLPSVNQDATKIGKQEMTAVGRACISKFLMDEIFAKTFHPGLEPQMGIYLKEIELNIRPLSPVINNQEELDALTTKVVQWRLATIDGLKESLASPRSEEFKLQFSKTATSNLTAALVNCLTQPAPPGIQEFAVTIVELAVSIAANIPLESRDVSIVYPLPGDVLQPFIMKTEAVIPPLEHPGDDHDSTSSGSTDKDEDKTYVKLKKEKGAGMLQAMMGNANSNKKPSGGTQGGYEAPAATEAKAKNDDGAQKVRFAGFVGVEVRGRQVLLKAPVWTLS